MVKELVFGHQNPDTDAIDSAIEYSHLQNQLGMDTEAVALGEPNEETKFVLDHFQQPAPRVIQQAHDDVSAVMLVDHNEAQQSVADIDQVQVTHVVDHHRIANFETAAPLYYRAEPVGCTSTIIWKLYQEAGVEVTPTIAGLMLSAIISDTLLLKSPTTTDDDRQVVEKCAQIAHLDYQDYGLQMLKAGADISQKSAADLVDLDAKSFEMGGKTIRIAQINVVDLPAALQRQAEFQEAMANSCQSNNYDLFVLAITNVLDSDTTLLAHGTAELLSKVEGAFGKKFEQDQMALPGVVSRKKQIVPPLQNQF